MRSRRDCEFHYTMGNGYGESLKHFVPNIFLKLARFSFFNNEFNFFLLVLEHLFIILIEVFKAFHHDEEI